MTTAEALEGFTATSEFELLAMAALRELDPEFALIIHTGINAAGKTIVHPLDGFARIPGSAVRYAAAEITTTALRKLTSKWLAESDRDFASLSDEAGDLVKAAREAARLRQTTPSAGFRVALVTNHEPSDDLQKAVDTYALRHRLEYTIVSRGALANYLDNTANGNYHRARLFRTLQTRLSWDLLHDIANESLALFATELQQTEDLVWIPEEYETDLQRSTSQWPLTFLVADSGRGKSTLSLRFGRELIASGSVALWCKPEYLDASVSLERALLDILQALRPELDELAGKAALEFAAQNRLLLIVDDVNRLPDPVAFCDRLSMRVSQLSSINQPAAEPATSIARVKPPSFLVPLWRSHAGKYSDSKELPKHVGLVSMKPMAVEQATRFVECVRAQRSRAPATLSPSATAQALWNDPFLLSTWARLWALRDAEPVVNDVLRQYIESLCDQAARKAGLLRSDIWAALCALSRFILDHRTLRPPTSNVLAFLELDARPALRALLFDGNICKESPALGRSAIAFRHDRLREFVLAATLIEADVVELPEDPILGDPLFAEVFAIVAAGSSESHLARVVSANPLSAAIAVGEHAPTIDARKKDIEQLLVAWWRDPRRPHSGLGRATAIFVSDWFANHATPIANELLQNQHDVAVYMARTRLGDVESAIRLCSMFGFGTRADWRVDAILEGERHPGNPLSTGLHRLFRIGLQEPFRQGALWLAGFLGTPALKDGALACWRSVTDKPSTFQAGIYAVAFTSSDLVTDMEELLDFWVTLDDTRDPSNMSL
jgi:hypothetical protein